MRATFNKALHYRVRFTCVTPMRSGVHLSDETELLRRGDGAVFLSGGAVAGAFRSWKDSEVLFGAKGIEGALCFSDAVIDKAQLHFRHRIRLRGKFGRTYVDAGVGISRTHQDIAVLTPGTKGEFTIIWRGIAPFAEIEPEIEEYLAAMNDGQIQLGAERSNDFGRVELSVFRGRYDMTVEAQREAWLNGQWEGEEITLAASPQKDIVLDVTALMPKSFVGSRTVAFHYTEAGQIIVPSSSIKGVLRRWCGQICSVLDTTELEEQLFGSNTAAGCLVVSDGIYSRQPPVKSRSRILIDRVSGASLQRPLYTSAAVGGELKIQLRLPASYKWAVGLLLYALRDFGLGMFELGAASAIGCGYAESLSVRASSPEGIGWVSVKDGAVSIDDAGGIIHSYMEKWGGVANDP